MSGVKGGLAPPGGSPEAIAMVEIRLLTVLLDPRTGLFDDSAVRAYLGDRLAAYAPAPPASTRSTGTVAAAPT